MAERKVDWGMQASYCEGHHMLMSCTRSYGKSIIELLIHTTEDLEGRKIPKTTVKAISSIAFHYSIPLFLIPDSQLAKHCTEVVHLHM